MKCSLPDDEFAHFEYRRNVSAHIFQNGYELIQDGGKLKQKRGNRDIMELKLELKNVLIRFGRDDYNFDLYIIKTFSPYISELFKKVEINSKINPLIAKGIIP